MAPKRNIPDSLQNTSLSAAGDVLGATLLISGLCGAIAGGFLIDFTQTRGGLLLSIRALCVLAVLAAVSDVFACLPNEAQFSASLPLFMSAGSAIGVSTTTLTIVANPNELRGLFLAILFAAGTIFGIGLAPLLVSVLAQCFTGDDAIDRTLALVCSSTSATGAVIFWYSARRLSLSTVVASAP